MLEHLSAATGIDLSAVDLLAYIAAVAAHPGFTGTFRGDLLDAKTMRVPLTAEPDLFGEAVRLGRRIVYLSTFGERCRPPDAVQGRLRALNGPSLEQPVPAIAESVRHDPARSVVTIEGRTGGQRVEGVVANVSADVYGYTTSTMNVFQSWFNYRRHNPGGKQSSLLDAIHPPAWTDRYTEDMIDLLHVLTLLTAERPAQQELLEQIMGGTLITRNDLETAGALPTRTGTDAKPAEFQPPKTSETLRLAQPELPRRG